MQKLRKKPLAAAVGLGVALAAALTALLCLVPCALITRALLPLTAGGACACVCACIAVMLASLTMNVVRRRQALPAGGLIAAGYTLLAALLCALGGERARFGPWLLWLAAAAVVGGLLGAVMSIRRRKRR